MKMVLHACTRCYPTLPDYVVKDARRGDLNDCDCAFRETDIDNYGDYQCFVCDNQYCGKDIYFISYQTSTMFPLWNIYNMRLSELGILPSYYEPTFEEWMNLHQIWLDKMYQPGGKKS